MSEIVLKTGSWQTNAAIVGMIAVFDEGNLPYDIHSATNELKFDTDILSDFSRHFWNVWFNRSKSQIAEYILATELYPSLLAIQDIDEANTEIISKKLVRFSSILKDKFIAKEKDETSFGTALGNSLKETNTVIDFTKLKTINSILTDKKTELKEKINAIQQNRASFEFLTNDYFIYYLTISKLKTIEINKLIPQGSGITQRGFNGNLLIDFQAYIDNGIKLYEQPTKNIKTCCMRCGSPLDAKKAYTIAATLTENNNNDDRKKSLMWNGSKQTSHQECFICQLAEYTLPLSLNMIFGNGLFVNDASSIRQLIQTNKQVSLNIFNNKKDMVMTSFLKALYTNQQTFTYDYADIQLIRMVNKNDNTQIRQTLLTKRSLQFITKNENQTLIKRLYAANYTRYDETVYIIDSVIEHITNNQLFDQLIIHMLKTEPSKYIKRTTYYTNITDLIRLNKNLKEMLLMPTIDTKTLSDITTEGQSLRRVLYAAGYDNKINGINHKLLMAVRSRNFNHFMDILLHTYLVVKRNVPTSIATLNKDTFTDAAYAFIAGLMSYESKNQEENE